MVQYSRNVVTDIVYADSYWDDQRFPISSVKKISGSEPADQSFRGGLVYGFDVGEGITFNIQCPHKMKLNTDIDAHFHFVLPTAGAGIAAENAKFEWTYSWADLNGVFPVETTLTSEVDVQTYSQYQHKRFVVGTILNSNKVGTSGVSSMLICSLTRVAASANEYGDEIWIAEADIHIEIDSPGSRTEYAK